MPITPTATQLERLLSAGVKGPIVMLMASDLDYLVIASSRSSQRI